ncbi:hypothetical protein NDU88_004532 [Pleurodeles waltl]|uniref:Uncharacterized protein n=1 Tax=Pleurodeles waltl TaxID=8319 RepID=A0AAV7QCA7_PLEWA|nr:hypothetical protein NDU88_004532 [Pleurodeles waltl]
MGQLTTRLTSNEASVSDVPAGYRSPASPDSVKLRRDQDRSPEAPLFRVRGLRRTHQTAETSVASGVAGVHVQCGDRLRWYSPEERDQPMCGRWAPADVEHLGSGESCHTDSAPGHSIPNPIPELKLCQLPADFIATAYGVSPSSPRPHCLDCIVSLPGRSLQGPVLRQR